MIFFIKDIEFPTTNSILPIQKLLRPDTSSVFEGKGRGVDYTDIVSDTITSILKVTHETGHQYHNNTLKIYLKDGCDGAGTMPALKSKEAASNRDGDHMFQYGIIPLKLTAGTEDNEKVLWKNLVPNSATSLRPVYLIRESENRDELLNFVIKSTDQARNKLNESGLKVSVAEKSMHVSCAIKDSMKDLKLKRKISGLGGADCILCKSKVQDWTDMKKIEEGFLIDRTASDTQNIFMSVLDEQGNIVIKSNDFVTRSGVTQEPISNSDQHSITITHTYINGCKWYFKPQYR